MLTIRQSMLGSYKKCPYKCYLEWGDIGSSGKYELEESVGNKYSRTGIAFHEVMEYAGNCMINNKSFTLDELLKLMGEKFDEIPTDMFDDEKDVLERKKSMFEQVVWTYENILQSKNFLKVENNFEVKNMYADMPPFTGTMDVISGKLEEQDVVIMDYKTGKVYTKNELNNNIQACIYSMAFYNEYGFLPKEFIFIFTKHQKIKRVPITLDFINRVSSDIVKMIVQIKNNEFEPNTSNKYFCKNFCEFYYECPKFKKTNKTGWDAVE